MNRPEEIIAEYYAPRAPEYERVYERQERQIDLRRLADLVRGAFLGHDVFEVACGTGYWTHLLAESAKSILATDANPELLEIAKQKIYGACEMMFVQRDAYSTRRLPSACTAGFHSFWWSHIPLQRIAEFLTAFHGNLPDGAPIKMIDNAYVEGSSTPICRRDGQGNTYQIRQLDDGSQYEVLKNFPSPEDLRRYLQDQDVKVTLLPYYWIAEYHLKR